MPPKEKGKSDKKPDKKAEDSPEVKLANEINVLEAEKTELNIDILLLKDKLKQQREEGERLVTEIEGYKDRIQKATQDYADILAHREEQIRISEKKLHALQAQVEELEQQLASKNEEIKRLQDYAAGQDSQLSSANNQLADKEQLEDAVRRQADLIERQTNELRQLKRTLEERESALHTSTAQIEELTLRSSGNTELKILFDEPWLVQVSYWRLKGELPMDREGGSLTALSGGKLLVMHGGQVKLDPASRDIFALNVETMLWDRPQAAQSGPAAMQHSTSAVSRTKMMSCCGLRPEGRPCNDVSIFNADTMKWMLLNVKGVQKPAPRAGHAAACIREKVFMFGGQQQDGRLMNDMWFVDQDSMHWIEIACVGQVPSPRRGASLCATEDGRRLYLFGGNDGTHVLADTFMFDTDKLSWSQVQAQGMAPEPREGHCATILSKYMIMSGGSSAGGLRRLGDTWVLELAGPFWEVLDEGAWTNNLPWLKNAGTYTAVLGNKVFVVKPNREERLDELQIIEFALPEDIERLRAQKKKDADHSDRLQLDDDATCGPTAIEVSWRAPTKNSDRIDRFKLMIATSTGVVRDVFQGIGTKFKVVGLKPNTEYIFCVKAIYEDGSFLWSESKAYHTKQ